MGIEAEELNQEENIDLAALANTDDQEVIAEEEALQLSGTEQKAYDQGWRPKDDFEGPEDNWKTAKEYVRDGEFLATIKELNQKVDRQEVDFNQRLENSNKLHEARKAREIEDLKTQQRDAVITSDTEAYDSAQKEIEKLQETPVETKKEQALDPVISEWESKNPWVHDLTDERTPVAQGIWNQYINKNPTASNAQALAHVDTRIGQLYPASKNNPRRDQQNTNETPTKRGKKASKTLSMADLTQDEKSEWAMFGQTMFKNENDFLKAVKDARVN